MKYKAKEFLTPIIGYAEKNKRMVFLLIIGVVMVIVFQIISNSRMSGHYVYDSEDNLVGVNVESGQGDSIPLEAVATGDNSEKESEEILLNFSGKGEAKAQSEERTVSQRDRFIREIGEIKRDIESRPDRIIYLPESLEDGRKLKWSRSVNMNSLILIPMFPMIIYLMYISEREKKKKILRKQREEIIRGLPSFNNQLILLLYSGLILPDAFERISNGYRRLSDDGSTYFERTIVGIWDNKLETNRSLIRVMEDESKACGVKEFTRITNILSDSQSKGTDLRSSLQLESAILWERRKKSAEEKGRLAESKLAFPLAMLLLALVCITAAPAMLTM